MNSRETSIKKRIDALEKLLDMINEVAGKVATKEVRTKVVALCNYAQSIGFTRTDKDCKVILNSGDEITIGLSDNKIWICSDALVGTLCGLHEMIQEMHAYNE